MIDLINAILRGVASVVGFVLRLLPDSPFTWNWSGLVGGTWWQVVSYFVPFGSMAVVLLSYVGAVGVWYLYRWFLQLIRFED